MQNTPNSFNTTENKQPEYNRPLNIVTKWDKVILQWLQAKSEEREHSRDEYSQKEWKKSGLIEQALSKWLPGIHKYNTFV